MGDENIMQSNKLLDNYMTLDEKLSVYRKIRSQMTDLQRQNFDDTFTIDFTHHTTAIEGNTLTLIETKMILDDKIVPKETTLFELDQVRGHAEAWSYVKSNVLSGIEITENVIKDIHERVVPARGIGGLYRNVPVFIKGAQHVPPNYKKVRELMKLFAMDISIKEFSNPVERAAWIHAEFVKIHPFQDGNGRTARLLLNYSLLLDDYPPINIKKDNVEEYFASLEEYSLYGNLEKFENLVMGNVHKSLDMYIEMFA